MTEIVCINGRMDDILSGWKAHNCLSIFTPKRIAVSKLTNVLCFELNIYVRYLLSLLYRISSGRLDSGDNNNVKLWKFSHNRFGKLSLLCLMVNRNL